MFVIMTGGLGPTEDDLTREVLAAVLDRPLRLDAAVLRHIEERFAHRRVTMAKNNRKQAMVPEGAEVLHNPRGTAPGLSCGARGGSSSACPASRPR